MFLSCCGINHNTCTLSEREPFQLQKDELAKATSDFKEITGAPEAVVQLYLLFGEVDPEGFG